MATVLGIDIGDNQIKAGMVDEGGAILAARTIPTPPDLDTFLPSLQDAIHWLIQATDMPAGVGVGCKGIVNPNTTTIEILPGALHFLEGLRIADIVGLPLEVPVFADNDARVALAGEMVWGAAKGRRLNTSVSSWNECPSTIFTSHPNARNFSSSGSLLQTSRVRPVI